MFKDVSKFKRLIILCVIGLFCIIILLGFWLNFGFGMPPEKVAPILVNSFVIIALFFNALSFAFTWNKSLNDSQGARESVTFNTALDWHRSPLKDYIIKIVLAEAMI